MCSINKRYVYEIGKPYWSKEDHCKSINNNKVEMPGNICVNLEKKRKRKKCQIKLVTYSFQRDSNDTIDRLSNNPKLIIKNR